MRMLALLALALLGLSPVPAWAQSIKMGAVVPLTGRYGAGGAQIRAGYEFAVERLNAGGGIPVGGVKMPVELVLLDDESDATKTVARMETLAAQGVIGYLGGFEPLHAVPDDRVVVLGLVTTKSPRLESVEALCARVEEAARLVPLERLALSPQCGFASTLEGNRVTPAEQEAKLRRVAETANRIWRGESR